MSDEVQIVIVGLTILVAILALVFSRRRNKRERRCDGDCPNCKR
ncbi:MAG: FeoB-associated Cys-rich membrane protein [Muribaculaceae bacterium]|nr:FeoB-associated Cys-rich membrane protein [Muribaculaceae bacterium]